MKENSIEEDIKNAEHFINSIKTDKEYKEENGWHGYYNKEIVELTRILEHILSDYKRVLKENEELKEEKINNYRMIALAQNEVLGYMQGYEDGKKLKRSAVACAVENQQYYIIKKEIEHYKEYIEKLKKENEDLHREINQRIKLKIENEKIVDTQFIPVQKVKDKISERQFELQQEYKDFEDDSILLVLQELLEGRK